MSDFEIHLLQILKELVSEVGEMAEAYKEMAELMHKRI